MLNELLFIGCIFGGLAVALAASYFGRFYLYAVIITITLYMNIAEANVIEVFGLATTLGTALYGVVFFSTDMLAERYGKKAAFQAIRISIFCTVLFHVLMQLTLLTTAVSDMQWFADGMGTVFTTSLRIVASSIVVYMISQSLDIWLYQKIHERTGDKMLWLRNNGSTLISQAVDTYLFTFLAFYGVFDEWLAMATVAYGFKVIVALSDTPFIYLNKMFTPRDQLKDQGREALTTA